MSGPPPRQLFAQPAHPYTEVKLLTSRCRAQVAPGEWLFSIPGAPPDLARPAIGCSFSPRCSRGAHEQRCANETPVPFVTITAEGPVMAECHFAVERVGAYPEMAGHAGGEP